uniref:Uncharacterized protein n=1 Tax=Anguilla anguilla TaxID=7936 RepID=A0A0E9RW20_ANGAN
MGTHRNLFLFSLIHSEDEHIRCTCRCTQIKCFLFLFFRMFLCKGRILHFL